MEEGAKSESQYEDERGGGRGALRVVGSADPYGMGSGGQICLLRWEKVAADG